MKSKNLLRDKRYLFLTFVYAILYIGIAGVMASCSKDDEASGESDIITLDSTYGASIDGSFTFHPKFMRLGIFSDDVVAEIGPVNSIYDITYIPEGGWADELPVKEGYGYVVHNKDLQRYSRVYIVEKTDEHTIAQYQCPFIPE